MEIPPLITHDIVALRAKYHKTVYMKERKKNVGKMDGKAIYSLRLAFLQSNNKYMYKEAWGGMVEEKGERITSP